MAESKAAKVSVCMPVYNGAKYIAESIQSVLGQTYRDLRLFVVDNCSTDNTVEIVNSFRDPRVTLLRNDKNIGLVGNWNRALSVADGEYLTIWAHDDVMLPDNLEKKVAVLDAHPKVGLVHSNLLLIDGQGEVLGKHWVEDSHQDYIRSGVDHFQRYIRTMPKTATIFIGSALVRRACYQQLGGFSTELSHTIDSEWLMRVLLFYDVACLGEPLVKYRKHPEWTSANFEATVENLRQHFLACRLVLDRYADRVPNRDALQSELSAAFAAEAIERGFSDAQKQRPRVAWGHLKMAVSIFPKSVFRPRCWRLLIRLLVGKPGLRVYHWMSEVEPAAQNVGPRI